MNHPSVVPKFVPSLLLAISLAIAMLLFSCQEGELVPNADSLQTDDFQAANDVSENLVSFFDQQPIEGQYIVVLRQEAFDADPSWNSRRADNKAEIAEAIADNILVRNRVDPRGLKHVYSSGFKGMSVRTDKISIDRLAQDPMVDFIEQDRLFALGKPSPVDPEIKTPFNPSSLPTPSNETTSYGVALVGGSISLNGSSKRAWILDTGIDLGHNDLSVDGSASTNFCTVGTFNSSGDDGHGHGTHVAGIIGAKANGFGTVGVAAGVKLVSVKVLSDEGEGTYSDLIAALGYVEQNAAPGDVVNISLGGKGSKSIDKAVKDCQQNSGAAIVIAAGNDSDDVGKYSPARAEGSGIYTIGSVGIVSYFSWYSNYGPEVDYAAPGEFILSTFINNGYAIASGTSMAAPHAAGVFLLTNTPSTGLNVQDPDGNTLGIIQH